MEKKMANFYNSFFAFNEAILIPPNKVKEYFDSLNKNLTPWRYFYDRRSNYDYIIFHKK